MYLTGFGDFTVTSTYFKFFLMSIGYFKILLQYHVILLLLNSVPMVFSRMESV